MKMRIWPFKKELKLEITDTQEVIEQRKKQEEDLKERIKQNRTWAREWLDETVNRLRADFEKLNPKPFKEGDIVTVDYYGLNLFKMRPNWLSSSQAFVKTFSEYSGVEGPMDLKVSRIWVSTGWLENQFDECNPDVWKIIHNTVGQLPLIDNLTSYLTKVQKDCEFYNFGFYGIKWAFDCDWQEMNLRKPGSDAPLIIKWGGFPCDSVFSAESAEAKTQKKMWAAEKQYLIAKEEYQKELKSFNLRILNNR